MKKINDKIKSKALTIASLEKQCQEGVNVEENMKKMTKIVESLTFDEIIQVDEYIYQEKLLTK